MATPGLYEHLKCYKLVFWISLLLQLYQIMVPIGLTVSGWICPFVHMDLLPFGEIQQPTPWEASCFAVVEQKSVALEQRHMIPNILDAHMVLEQRSIFIHPQMAN